MNKPIVSLTAFFGMAFTLAIHAADLKLEVSLPTQKQGAVLAGVSSKSESFPHGKPLMVAMAQAANGKAVLQFAGLAEGDYAISAFLDENGNQKLDANLIGLPTELYGFSRDARGLTGPPAFNDAAFRPGAENTRQAIDLK